MAPMHDEIQIRREAMRENMATLQQYRGNDAYLAMIRLLKSIEDCYGDDLREVSPDGLRFKQGGCKQCHLLRMAMMDGGDLPPKL